MSSLRVVVIGGGAAGFWGAITCAETYPQSRVQVLEAGREVLTKVRISGGGRCNVTHACFEPALLVQNYPRGAQALRGPFSKFQPRDTLDWFIRRGVELKTEADGRIFPVSDDSATIVDCLLQTALAAGVTWRCSTPVQRIIPAADSLQVELKSGESLAADRVLLATGSSPQGWGMAASLGHQIHPPVPSLFTLNCTDPRLQELAGVSVNPVQLRLDIAGGKPLTQTGPLLITHWGLSGPAVLKLSAWAARVLHAARYQAHLVINWLPAMDAEKLRQQLLAVKSQLPQRSIFSNCPLLLPQRLWQRLCLQVGIMPQQRWAEVSHQMLHNLIQELTQGRYLVQGKGQFKEEFVTCGGVDLKQVDFKTMASRCCPGLYFAGEILDIDGVTGGFNFQSAWTTAWLAGQAMGKVAE